MGIFITARLAEVEPRSHSILRDFQLEQMFNGRLAGDSGIIAPGSLIVSKQGCFSRLEQRFNSQPACAVT
jgi:hypothetical protein